VRNIRKNLVKRIFDLIDGLEPEKFDQFYQEFGPVIKVGIPTDYENRERISKLLRYRTTKTEGKYIPLSEYVSRMHADQEDIYYITGESFTALEDSPHLERLKANDIEVVLMTDPVDEWVVQTLRVFEGRKFTSAEKGDLGTEKGDEKKKDEFGPLFAFIKGELEDKVKDVKASTHLKDSPACLSGETQDMSPYLEKILRASGQKTEPVKRILEINVDHPAVFNMKFLFEKDNADPALKDYSRVLYDLAVISEGGRIDDPARFSRTVGKIMAEASTVEELLKGEAIEV
jgi:molecular chaperone HtpG